MNKDKIKIAGNLTIGDWHALKPSLNPDCNDNWDKAFEFFEKRVETRYLKPIKKILEMDLQTGQGFAVVNLQCSLIETIESFYNGWIYDCNNSLIPRQRYYKRKIYEGYYLKEVNGMQIFISFFNSKEPFKTMQPQIDGKDFYINVRCGLLHETQTKNKWVINAINKDNPECFYDVKTDKKIIYRSAFQKAIENVIKNYKDVLVNETNENSIEFRKNFIAKIEHIVEVS